MIDCVPETMLRVLDGGSILHRIPWKHGTSFFGKIAKGGEEESNIKDDTHHRRGHSIHAVVSFTAETDFSGKKEEFYKS